MVGDTLTPYKLIAIEDIILESNQTSFAQTVSTVNDRLVSLGVQYNDDVNRIKTEAKTLNMLMLYYFVSGNIGPLIEPTTENVGQYVPINFKTVDTLTTQLTAENSCNTTIQGVSSFVLPQGTYRITAVVSVVSLQAAYGTNSNRPMYVRTDIFTSSPPQKSHLSSAIHKIPVDILNENGEYGDSYTVTPYIHGFIYLCKTSEVALRIFTTSDVHIGNRAEPNALSIAANYRITTGPGVYRDWQAPVQLMIEQVSPNDIFGLHSQQGFTLI